MSIARDPEQRHGRPAKSGAVRWHRVFGTAFRCPSGWFPQLGKRLQFANLKMAVKKWIFPVRMVIVHSYVNVYQRVAVLKSSKFAVTNDFNFIKLSFINGISNHIKWLNEFNLLIPIIGDPQWLLFLDGLKPEKLIIGCDISRSSHRRDDPNWPW